MKELQTTPEMCEHELAMYSQMERGMCADAWMAMDAAAAHELLALVKELWNAGEFGAAYQDFGPRLSEWVDL